MFEYEKLKYSKIDHYGGGKLNTVVLRTRNIVLVGIYARNKSSIHENFDISSPKSDIYVVFRIKKTKLSEYYIAVRDGKYLDLKKLSGYAEPFSWKIAKSTRKQDSRPNVLDKIVIDKLLEELE